tara:strand:+ start:343 stop:1350 length:1008 start_codon:yes stop_codon:yes gene_type:complete
MAREIINTGTTANDGTGDTLRGASTKINTNFSTLFALLGGDSAGVGVGSTTVIHDSGFDIVGTTFRTKVGAINPASEVSINFPDSAGEVVVDTATQTLTNKTFTGATLASPVLTTPQINDTSSDHQYIVAVNELAADRTVTLPLLTGDDTLVFEGHSQTLSNKTLSVPSIHRAKVQEWLADSIGQPVLSFTATGNARNRLRVQGVASGSAPILSAVGSSDTNININVNSKGSGSIRITKAAYTTATAANSTTASANAGVVFLTGTSTGTVTFANGTTPGETVTFIRRAGSGAVTLTPTTFAQGTSINFDANDTATVVWDNTTGWNITSGYGYAVV